MRRWHYGANGYHKTSYIVIDVAPWYVFAIDDLSMRICDFVQRYLQIPFPNIGRTKIVWTKKDIEYCTWKEAWRDFASWFCCNIHMPIFQWCNSKIDMHSIEVDYDTLRRAVYKLDPEYWDEDERISKEMKKDDLEESKEETEKSTD